MSFSRTVSSKVRTYMDMSPFINPFAKHICPHCGHSFYPGECPIYSSVTKNKELQSPRAGLWARCWVPPLVGPVYTRELARRRCPKCEQLFPYNIERARSYTIAIIGDVSAGKSHYIAACIDQLKKYALQVVGCTHIIGLDNTDEEFTNKFYKPVFVQKQQIPPTQQATIKVNKPLVYELVFRKETLFFSQQSINLLFYDSSGEDIAQQDRLVQYSSYIANADAIIFLADPLTMPNIVKELPRSMQPKAIRERSSTEVFNRVLHTFRNVHGLPQNAKMNTAVAITLSKSDLLKYVTKKERQEPLFLTESIYTNALDSKVFEMVDKEMRRFIQQYGDQALLHASEAFENAAFFAVSATGFSPDETGHFPIIEPKRCLDPLLWTLWKLGVIKLP